MERKSIETLVVNDDDLNCKDKKNLTLDNITIGKIGFLLQDMERFDMIVYKGSLGQKVIRLRL